MSLSGASHDKLVSNQGTIEKPAYSEEHAMSGTGAEAEDKTADNTEVESATEEKQADNANPLAHDKVESAAEDSDIKTDAGPLDKESKEGTAGDDNGNQPTEKKAGSVTLTQIRVSPILSEVLQEEQSTEAPKIRGFHFPMIFDLLLGAGLLVAVGGFSVGLLHMYIVHSASQFISEQRYEKAITVLKGAPLPQVFSRPGTDTEELLSKARYLDAMDRIESNNNVDFALKELAEIRPGSKYFALAQEAINENTEPAEVLLQGGAETTEAAAPEKEQTLLEKTLKEDQEQK